MQEEVTLPSSNLIPSATLELLDDRVYATDAFVLLPDISKEQNEPLTAIMTMHNGDSTVDSHASVTAARKSFWPSTYVPSDDSFMVRFTACARGIYIQGTPSKDKGNLKFLYKSREQVRIVLAFKGGTCFDRGSSLVPVLLCSVAGIPLVPLLLFMLTLNIRSGCSTTC